MASVAGEKVTVQRLTALAWSGDARSTRSSDGRMVTQGVCPGGDTFADGLASVISRGER